ncbi:unnamed protein product [Gordionus sp. m RMFG-2023]
MSPTDSSNPPSYHHSLQYHHQRPSTSNFWPQKPALLTSNFWPPKPALPKPLRFSASYSRSPKSAFPLSIGTPPTSFNQAFSYQSSYTFNYWIPQSPSYQRPSSSNFGPLTHPYSTDPIHTISTNYSNSKYR